MVAPANNSMVISLEASQKSLNLLAIFVTKNYYKTLRDLVAYYSQKETYIKNPYKKGQESVSVKVINQQKISRNCCRQKFEESYWSYKTLVAMVKH